VSPIPGTGPGEPVPVGSAPGPLEDEQAQLSEIPQLGAPRSRGLLRSVGALAKRDKLFAIGLALVAVALFLAAFGPLVAPQSTTDPDPAALSSPPSAAHWFGTDSSGLDVFSRTIAAPRYDVTIALIACIVSLLIGSVIGLIATHFESRWGTVVMRTADVIQAFPLFVLAMVIVVTAGRSLFSLVAVVAFLNIPIYIRLMRSQVLALKHRGFVDAARAAGVPERLVAFRHVYPNAIGPSIVQVSITMGWAIILIAGISFVGAGIRPPTPEWGSMIAVGAGDIVQGDWWSALFPGVAMSLTVFGFAIVGEGVRKLVQEGR
jgi:peptide/nickel transport system permease protein